MEQKTKELLDLYISDKYEQLFKAAKNVLVTNNLDIEDVFHENILYLYDLKDEKIEKMIKDNTLHKYFSRCVKLSVISPLSKYQQANKFKPVFDHQFVEIEEEEEVIEAVDSIRYKKVMEYLNSINWYDRALYLQYMKGDNYRVIKEKTNIPLVSIFYTVNEVRKGLKEFLKLNNIKIKK